MGTMISAATGSAHHQPKAALSASEKLSFAARLLSKSVCSATSSTWRFPRLTGFGVNAFLQFFARYKRYIRWGEIFAGALLVGVGGLVFANKLTWLITLLPRGLFRFAL